MSTSIPTLPYQLGVFTSEQATAAGWSESALRNAVRTGRVDRLWRGVYAMPARDDLNGRLRRVAQRAVAGAVTNNGAMVSHLGAAAVHSWDLWAPHPRPCVTVPAGAVTAVPGVHVHRADVPRLDRWRAETVRLTSPARTIVDLGREFGPEVGTVAGDAAMRAGRTDLEAITAAFEAARGLPGVEAARVALALLDPRSESVLESRSRFRISAAGLPSPQTQVDIFRLDGQWLARVDFYWPEFGVVGEADGDGKYDDRRDVVAEKYREDRLRALGIIVVRWGWRHLEPFGPTAAKLASAFGRGETVVSRRQWHTGHDVVDSVSI